jgi:hypothetical protein
MPAEMTRSLGHLEVRMREVLLCPSDGRVSKAFQNHCPDGISQVVELWPSKQKHLPTLNTKPLHGPFPKSRAGRREALSSKPQY